MRPIYTSPRPENIDRMVALFAEHGIETTVTNRSAYKRAGYKRFSYTGNDDRSSWARVEVKRAADLTRARALLRDMGIEPLTRHAEVLAESRRPLGTQRHRLVANRTRILALAAVSVAVLMLMLKMTGIL